MLLLRPTRGPGVAAGRSDPGPLAELDGGKDPAAHCGIFVTVGLDGDHLAAPA